MRWLLPWILNGPPNDHVADPAFRNAVPPGRVVAVADLRPARAAARRLKQRHRRDTTKWMNHSYMPSDYAALSRRQGLPEEPGKRNRRCYCRSWTNVLVNCLPSAFTPLATVVNVFPSFEIKVLTFA